MTVPHKQSMITQKTKTNQQTTMNTYEKSGNTDNDEQTMNNYESYENQQQNSKSDNQTHQTTI